MQSYNLVWEKTLEYLEASMHDTAYKSFIKTLKPVILKDCAFYFEVSTPLHREMLEKYKAEISSALNAAYADTYGASQNPITAEFLLPKEANDILSKNIPERHEPQVKRKTPTINLNPAYTFETFVVGESNRIANAAAHAVAKEPGNSYNPLFLYGGVGLGKTHLMHAIGNEILKDRPDADIMYVTSETFINDLVHMITLTNNNANIDVREQFRNKYRAVDVLMVDDIQFIAGKATTQDEFFHTFNALYELEKQIVITSDRPPKEMDKLEERMRSRFEWGMVIDVTAPDYETRVAILIKKAEQKYWPNTPPIDSEVYHYIASQENTNIRTLEGALHRLIMYAEHYKNEFKTDRIDINTAKMALDDYFPAPKNRIITPKIVTDAVCKYFKISESDILGSKKNRDIAYPRQIAMYIIRDITELSYKKIAEYFKKDHSTIMYAEEQIKKNMEKDEGVREAVQTITAKITG